MSSSNPIRELLSALFQAGSETVLREEGVPSPHDDYLDTTSWHLDPDTNEAWEPPSLTD
jgi:hypothetical protein